MKHKYVQIEELKGKIFTSVYENGGIRFTINDDLYYVLEHEQECCESVYVESIVGDLSDLVGVPILNAEEVNSDNYVDTEENREFDGSDTWTFYKFATIKGYVDLRWYGTSNGYYSESVSIIKYWNENET